MLFSLKKKNMYIQEKISKIIISHCIIDYCSHSTLQEPLLFMNQHEATSLAELFYCPPTKWHKPVFFFFLYGYKRYSTKGLLLLSVSNCVFSCSSYVFNWVSVWIPSMPCESGHSHQLGSALLVPSALISEHRSLRCDQRSPPRIIYQLLWCSLPDVIL